MSSRAKRRSTATSVDSEGASDAHLVRAARQGQASAQAVLYRRHARVARGLARRLLGPRGEVEDVVQEAFFQAFSSLRRLDDGQAFASWLCTIVTRVAGRARRRGRVAGSVQRAAADVAAVGAGLAATSAQELAAELRRLERIVASLPGQTRLVFVLNRLHGLRHDEIALRLAISNATVRRRLHAAEQGLASPDASARDPRRRRSPGVRASAGTRSGSAGRSPRGR